MDDQVKITVIATGFRDQMPERRSRMLSIGEVVVVEEPVVSVPVVARSKWMNEPVVPVVAKAPAPFLSQMEEGGAADAEESEEAFFFASSAPSIGSNAGAAAHAMQSHSIPEPEFDPVFGSSEPAAAASRPQFAEMAEEPVYTPLPRDYASDFVGGVRRDAEVVQERAQPVAALVPEADDEETQRDLDTPTFLRRLRF
jgi:cell division protein FtsZ